MPQILLETDSIGNFKGDGIFCYCDVDLSKNKNNQLLQILKYPNQEGYKNTIKSKILNSNKNSKSDLLKELSAIGEIQIGNAVITKAYELNAKYFIFIPYMDSEDINNHITSVSLHQALRSAFSLASLYNLSRVAVPILKIKIPKKDTFEKLLSLLWETKSPKTMTEDEILNIIIAISKEFSNSSLKEVVIYK